jgi:endonuclease/exonuclease/phosphatase family metal-dependent hydrolase
METFRVVTWNLWWRFGDWERRLDAIRSVLVDLQPDVCGFQGVWMERGRNLAEILAAEFGAYGKVVPSLVPPSWRHAEPDPAVGLGNAVISKWPVHAYAPCHLGGKEGHNVLHAAIDAPRGRLDFFTTALATGYDQAQLRRDQVADVARFIAQQHGGVYPPILTGSLAAEPDTDEIRLLGGYKTKPAIKGQRILVDAWRYAADGDGYTRDRRNPHVRDAFEPSSRTDYILIGPAAGSGHGQVEFIRMFGDAAVGNVWPSAHAGIVADLRL